MVPEKSLEACRYVPQGSWVPSAGKEESHGDSGTEER